MSDLMRAVVWTAYGPPEVLRFREVEKPAPKAHEVLIRVRAASVTAGDCEMRAMKLPGWVGIPMRLYVGLGRPKRVTVLGQEVAGEVESVGEAVRRFKPGDHVFGATGFRLGGYAEYVCLPEESDDGILATKPPSLGFEEAAAVPFGGLEALHFLKKAGIRRGEHVLISGAGGTIGTFGVQLAKHFGAEVTAVDRASKLDMLRSIGADHVIDYLQEDFTQNGRRYDVIFDVMGTTSYARSMRSLDRGGRYLLANPRVLHMLRGLRAPADGGKRVIAGAAGRDLRSLTFLSELIGEGRLKAVIDRTYPLEQAAEAHRYFETGQKQGNIVLAVDGLRG